MTEGYAAGQSQQQNSSVQEVMRRNVTLKNERSTWEPSWRDINDYIQPRRGRFFTEDKNKGDRKDRAIVNNRATRASRILASGLMAGLTNQSRPWFRLTMPDPMLAESGSVKSWLGVLEDRMRWVFQRSNIYLSLHGLYSDLTFGTSAMYLEDDPRKVLRAYLFPIGSYALSLDSRQRVDTLYRESQMTVGQLVERFGIERCSGRTQSSWKEKRYDEWREVLHVIEPNREATPGHRGRRGMPFRSCWLELGGDEAKGFLRESGYAEFPAMCPRWSVTGEDIYGDGPGFEAIGDARALQTLERRAAQVVDKIANPATQWPSSLRGESVSALPGQHVFVDAMGPQQMVRPVYTPDPRALDSVELKIRQHEQRLDQAFFADLWLMLANDQGGKMTATEVTQRQEEKMLQLGPVLQRLEDELLDPLIERTLGIMWRAGLVPPPPPEVQGQELKVEYVSVLAQAQKLVAIQGVHELTAYVTSLAQAQQAAGMPPDALDKFDVDQAIDEVSEMLGAPPDLVRTDDQVATIRQQRQQAQAQAQALAAAQQGAETAKTMSDTNLEGDNVLSRMLPAVGGARAAA